MKTFLLFFLLGPAMSPAAIEGISLLKVPEGARSAALGGAFSMESGGTESLWYNPAGVAGMQGSEIGFSHASWIGDTSREFLAGAFGNGKLGLGFFAQYASTQDLARDAFGNAGQSFGLQNMNVGLDLGWRQGVLRFGLGAKMLEQGLGGQQATGFAGDLGLQAGLWEEHVLLSLAAQNFGSAPEVGSGNSPVRPAETLRAGLGLVLPAGLSVLGEYRHFFESGQDSGALGLEYAIRVSGAGLAFRAGWESGLGLGNIAGLSVGTGANWGGVSIDYAFQTLGDLGSAQRISLSWRLSAPPSASPAKGRQVLRRRAKADFDAGLYRDSALLYRQLAETDDAKESAKMLYSAGMGYWKLQLKDQSLACFREAFRKDPSQQQLKGWIERIEASK